MCEAAAPVLERKEKTMNLASFEEPLLSAVEQAAVNECPGCSDNPPETGFENQLAHEHLVDDLEDKITRHYEAAWALFETTQDFNELKQYIKNCMFEKLLRKCMGEDTINSLLISDEEDIQENDVTSST